MVRGGASNNDGYHIHTAHNTHSNIVLLSLSSPQSTFLLSPSQAPLLHTLVPTLVWVLVPYCWVVSPVLA